MLRALHRRSVNSVAFSRLNIVFVVVAGLLAFSGTLGGGFLGDDFVYVSRFREMAWPDWPRFFTQEWSGGLWGIQLKELRPFAALSFMIDARLWGGEATGWRLTNLLLLLGSAGCVMQLAGRYSTQASRAALIAGLVFVLHPVQAEPVAWITGRVDLLAALAALGFWCAADQYGDTRRLGWLFGSLAALFVGIFSKEFCLLAPGLLFLAWCLIPNPSASPWKPRIHVLVGSLLIVGIYAWCRHQAFGSDATRGNANLQDPGVWQRQASYVGWLLPWLPFAPRHEWEAPPAGTWVRLVWLTAASTFVLGALWLRIRQRVFPAAVLFFSGFWWIGTTAGLLFVGYFSPRHLHFTTAGLAIAVGVGLSSISSRPLRIALCAGVALWLAGAQFRALQPWREAGDMSAQALTLMQAELSRAPAGTVLALAAPTGHQTAWLWSWSAPHLAAAPFLNPGLPPERVLFGNGNYYRPDWQEQLAPRYADAVRHAPAVISLVMGSDGRVRCRTVTAGDLALHAAVLASLAENGLTNDEWITWVQQLNPP